MNKIKEFLLKIFKWINIKGLILILIASVLTILFSLGLKSLNYTDAGTLFGVNAVLTALLGLGKSVYDSIRNGEFIKWSTIIFTLVGIIIGDLFLLVIL